MARYTVSLIGVGVMLIFGTACNSSQTAEAQQNTAQNPAPTPDEQGAKEQQPTQQERQPVAGTTEPRGGKPNILFIMGDDIGWMQPSIYHEGLMVGETPNIDRIGHEGAKFMDYL